MARIQVVVQVSWIHNSRLQLVWFGRRIHQVLLLYILIIATAACLLSWKLNNIIFARGLRSVLLLGKAWWDWLSGIGVDVLHDKPSLSFVIRPALTLVIGWLLRKLLVSEFVVLRSWILHRRLGLLHLLTVRDIASKPAVQDLLLLGGRGMSWNFVIESDVVRGLDLVHAMIDLFIVLIHQELLMHVEVVWIVIVQVGQLANLLSLQVDCLRHTLRQHCPLLNVVDLRLVPRLAICWHQVVRCFWFQHDILHSLKLRGLMVVELSWCYHYIGIRNHCDFLHLLSLS